MSLRASFAFLPVGPRRPRSGPRAALLGVLGLLVSAEGPSWAQAPGSRSNRADYTIQAHLDGETKRLTGNLELRWTNQSGEEVQDLWFHLYLNAFSNNRSTHLEESDGKLRDEEVEDGWGWSQVKSVRLAGVDATSVADLMPSFRYRRPDDGNEEDRTVFSVELPRPVKSGETIRVLIDWDSQLPLSRRRTGYKDDFLLVAQWFPKLGVYEAGRGWNCHQFHSNTEFYSNYGTYEVTLDLPNEYAGKVWASGKKQNETSDAERVRVQFVAPSPGDQRREDAFGKRALVHDFTWTADPEYLYPPFVQTFRFKDWAERFPEEVAKAHALFGETPELRNVDVTVLVQPEHEGLAERHFRATCAALFFYGLWFGEYPYEHITVVDPAWGSAAGGMEYPTLFTCGTRLFQSEDMHSPEGVTVHECGHQFWYGLVGNNEFEAAWLDEGFNSYTDSEVMWRVYGPQRETTSYSGIPVDGVRVSQLPGGARIADALAVREISLPVPFLSNPRIKLLRPAGPVDYWRDQPALTFVPQWTDPRWHDRMRYLGDPDTDPIDTPGWLYADRSSYVVNSYPRTAVALRTLQGLVGDQAFFSGMRHFARTWRYEHPYPQDFYAAFQEGAGIDIDWYFRELFQSTGTVDWSIDVKQERRREARGYFQGEGGEFIELARMDDDSADEVEEPYRIEVELRLEGELRLPLPVRLTFDDGSTRDLVWTREEQGERTWKRIELESEQKLVSAVIDPQRSYYIDLDMSNNDWFDEVDPVASWRWSERVLAQYQHYLHFIQGLGG